MLPHDRLVQGVIEDCSEDGATNLGYEGVPRWHLGVLSELRIVRIFMCGLNPIQIHLLVTEHVECLEWRIVAVQ